MKFTNVKQLIIKFMGGGLINFPTRFLRWVKINGDTEDDGSDDDGGGSEENNSDMLFKIATIQPTKYGLANMEGFILYDIKDLSYDIYKTYEEDENDTIFNFAFTKEEISKLGFDLTELEQLPVLDVMSEFYLDNTNSILIDNSIIQNNFIPGQIRRISEYTDVIGIQQVIVRNYRYRIIRISYNNDDNLYAICDNYDEH